MKEANCREIEVKHCLDSSIQCLTPHISVLMGPCCVAVAAWMPSKRGDCQEGRLGSCLLSLMFLKGWLMPDVKEASMFLEETDLSVEGGIASSGEGRAQVLSWCAAAKASGNP